jgi:hypothetical protein
VLPSWRLPEAAVFAVWPPGTTRPALTIRFVEFVAERLRTLFLDTASDGDPGA